jgi:hypothetical protein
VHPAVPVAEFAHYVNEMKANENYEFQKEYEVSNGNTWEIAYRRNASVWSVLHVILLKVECENMWETTPRRDEMRKFKSAINCVFLFLYCYFSVQDLPSNTNTAWEVAKKPFNKQKNRYGNIVTCTV